MGVLYGPVALLSLSVRWSDGLWSSSCLQTLWPVGCGQRRNLNGQVARPGEGPGVLLARRQSAACGVPRRGLLRSGLLLETGVDGSSCGRCGAAWGVSAAGAGPAPQGALPRAGKGLRGGRALLGAAGGRREAPGSASLKEGREGEPFGDLGGIASA